MNRPLGLRLAVFFALQLTAPVGCFAAEDFIDRPLNELVGIGLNDPPSDVRVTTAAKYGQSLADAPTAVRVVTREDIRTFGYRTLGEALRSLPGLTLTSDRQDVYLDGRGYTPAGSFNTRFLILIDGERSNDVVFDSSLVGGEFPIDVDLIDRIEYAPGPSSAIYGRNAMFGVINVITRRGNSFKGGELSPEYGGFDTYKGRVSYGKRFENGAELLLSATDLDRRGPNHPPDVDSSHAWDSEQRQNYFGKLSYGPWTLEAGHVYRGKGVNDDGRDHQAHTFVVSNYEDRIADGLNLSLRAGFHQHLYSGNYPYFDGDYRQYFREWTQGQWWDAEARFSYTGWERHHLLFGTELQHNFRALVDGFDTFPSDIAVPPGDAYIARNFLAAGYLQDQFRVLDSLTLLAGIRYDHNPFGSRASPRIGLTWAVQEDTTLKLLWGSAYRPPNLMERVGLPPRLQSPDLLSQWGNLQSETIDSFELTLEHQIRPSSRLSAMLYHYDLSGAIHAHANTQRVSGQGMELNAEHRFANGARANLSYTLQGVDDDHSPPLSSSPNHMVKLHVSTPLFSDHWRLGLENLYSSDRRAFTPENGSGRSSGFLLTNLTITTDVNAWLSFSASVYNLFDVRYKYPVRSSFGVNEMTQDGIDFRLKMNLRF